MKNKIYLACYSRGEYESEENRIVFASSDKSKVTKWVTKFNKILKKWNEYYDQFCDDICNFRWIKDEYYDKYYQRWYSLHEINKAYWMEVEIR